MAAIYLDESGDMGFDFSKAKTSKYFVITCLFIVNKRPAEKIVREIIRNFSAKERERHSGVLHANKETERTRRKVLTRLSELDDVSLISIYLNKSKVHTNLQDQKHILYNFVTNILIDRLMRTDLLPVDEPIKLIASKRETKKILNDNFKSYLEKKTSGSKIDITVEVKTPTQEKCLQLADFASWAIFRNREHNDDTYYTLVQKIIIENKPLFP